MADTRFLKDEVEVFVRGQLAVQYGRPFEKQFLPLSPGGRHEFDAVSADGTVVASIKSASGKTSGGRNPSGKIKDCLAELYYLSLVDAPTRLLVLTTPEFYDIFTTKTTGEVAEGIEIVLIPLPAEMQKKVDEIKKVASKEVSPS